LARTLLGALALALGVAAVAQRGCAAPAAAGAEAAGGAVRAAAGTAVRAAAGGAVPAAAGAGAAGVEPARRWPERWPQPALGAAEPSAVEVLFTFDDGPHPVTTPRVLDILAEHRIRAVFFLVGRMVVSRDPRAREILARAVREGHILANHTMRHTNLCREPPDAAVQDLDGGREAIERVTGMRVHWFRAPFGVRCEQLELLLAERGIEHFHWDLDPQEWRHGSVERTVRVLTARIGKATGRNVILLHDTKEVTVRALPRVLRWIREENARRAYARRPPIRVLQAPDIAVERIAPGVRAWLSDAAEGPRQLPKAIAALLP
jgi:peptidoglycan/xylan/chitin deacetylase (PgdA/CDA1 family)